MRHQTSIFRELTKLVDWAAFDRAVAVYGADHRVRRLRTRDQFLALLFGQLAGAPSLRAIEDGLASSRTRLYHAGARTVARATLADANAKRPFAVYRDVFAAMVAAARPGVRRKLRTAVRLIDATRIRLSDRSQDWARLSRHTCAAKLHIVYDPHAALPLNAAVSAENVSDILPAKALKIEPGATYVFDLAYYCYEWWARLDAAGCRFVTRLKTNTVIAPEATLPVVEGSAILSDRIGRLPQRLARSRKNPFAAPVREIIVRRDDGKTLRLVTNDLDSPAPDIAALYKQRWEIELFFRWIKQNLKIKRFLGRSENAIRLQIIAAMIAYTLLRIAQRRHRIALSPIRFTQLVAACLFLRKPLAQIEKPPPTNPSKPKSISSPQQHEFSYA